MATTKKKIAVEIGVASLIENPLEEHIRQVVKVNYPCDDLGHTMRNAEEPMTSSDWDSEERNLSQDSPSEDSDCYFCERHREGHDTSDMNLRSEKECYFCQRRHTRKMKSANGCAGHGSEFAEDSEDPKSLDNSKENIDDINGQIESEYGMHGKSEGTEDTEVVKDIKHSSFKYRRVESSDEKHVWEREEIEGDAKVTEESDVIINSAFTDEDLEVSDFLSNPVSTTRDLASTASSQDNQNPVSSIQTYESPENSLVIQSSVFEGGDIEASDTSGKVSRPEDIPKEEDVESKMERIDNAQVIKNSVSANGDLSAESSQTMQNSRLTTEENVSIQTQSTENVTGIEDFDSLENERSPEGIVLVSGRDESQLSENSLKNNDLGEYSNDLQGAEEAPPEGENAERSMEHIDNSQVINNSVFTVDSLEDDLLSPVTDIPSDVSTCGSESNDNDTGVNFDVSAAYSIKTDDEHDLTKDSAIVLDSPGSFDFSQSTDMSLGDVPEDTNEIRESQPLGTTNFHQSTDMYSNIVQNDTNVIRDSLQSFQTMEVTNIPSNVHEMSDIVEDIRPKEDDVGVELSENRGVQGDISEIDQVGVDTNLDKSKAASAVDVSYSLLNTSESLISNLSTYPNSNINVQSIPGDGSSIDVDLTFLNRSAISVENNSIESYQQPCIESNLVKTEVEDQELPVDGTAEEEFERPISGQRSTEEKKDSDSESGIEGETAGTPEDAATADHELSDDLEGQLSDSNGIVDMEREEDVVVKSMNNVAFEASSEDVETLIVSPEETAEESDSMSADEGPEIGSAQSEDVNEETETVVAGEDSETVSVEDFFDTLVEKRVNEETSETTETHNGLPGNVNESSDISGDETEPSVAGACSETPSIETEDFNGSMVQSLAVPVIEMKNENLEIDIVPQTGLESQVSQESIQHSICDESISIEDTDIPQSIQNGENEHEQNKDISKDTEISDSSELKHTDDEISVQNIVEHITDVRETEALDKEEKKRGVETSPVMISEHSEAKDDEEVQDTTAGASELTVSELDPDEAMISISTENNLFSGVMDPVLIASSTPAKPPEKVNVDSESTFLSESYYDPPLFVSVHNMVESFASKENGNADETLSDQKSPDLSMSSEHLAGHVKSNISIFSKPDEVESPSNTKLSNSDLCDKSEKMGRNVNISKLSKSMPNLYTSEDSRHDLSLEELKNRRKPFRAIKDMFEKRTTEVGNISDMSPYKKVTYRSRTFISLTPSSNPPEYSSRSSIRFSQSDEIIEKQRVEDQTTRDGQVINRGKEEKRYSDSFGDTTDSRAVREVNVQSMGGGSAQQNGYDKDEVQYSEMSSVRNAFESGGPQQNSVPQSQPATWDDQEEGVFENEPVKRSDVARESDRDIGAGLPEVGMAKNLLNRFSQIESEPKDYHKEITPPRQVAAGKVEYESEPSPHIQIFEGKAEAGIFESEPQINPDVVRSGEVVNEPLPERGTAKNIASKFKQLESGAGSYSSPGKREITPDRSAGKVEFVSEPKTTIEKYEGKAEAGVFENQPQHYEGVVRAEEGVEEILPERGTAKNIAQRFKQMESGSGSSSPRGKREITPDKFTRGEYVSEPRAHVEVYEGKAEAGVFESQPQDRPDVVKSDQYLEETLPERGFAKNVAAKFKEMESNVKSPPPTPGRVKEFTPPRETGVFESQPQSSPDVVSEHVPVEEIIPEKGYAKNLVSRFKQIEEENSKVAISNRKNKEFTPPRAEAGVFENEPKQFIPDYNQKTDSGISENNPESRSDVFKETDPAKYEEELPERGTAKNLVSRWKQMESKSGNQSPGSGGRVKEFTPPREEERVKALRTAKSPAGNFESVQPGDLPGQYQQSSEPSMFESEPETRADVFREADTDWTEGMPKENAAKKRIEKFKQIQANANKEQPKPISRKEDGDRHSPENEVTQQEAATPKKKGGFFIPTTPADKCGACQKTVYAMERFEMNKVIYHKNCFRCSHCKSKLTPKTFAVNNGIIYCTNHLMQLFKSKGNYDEGFGREQHKKKWLGEGAKDNEQEAS